MFVCLSAIQINIFKREITKFGIIITKSVDLDEFWNIESKYSHSNQSEQHHVSVLKLSFFFICNH